MVSYSSGLGGISSQDLGALIEYPCLSFLMVRKPLICAGREAPSTMRIAKYLNEYEEITRIEAILQNL